MKAFAIIALILLCAAMAFSVFFINAFNQMEDDE